MYENNLKCIVKDKTCFKNPNNPISIYLFLTNFSNCFQNPTDICTGLSDFHKMIVTVQKYTFFKSKPRVIHYRCYKDVDNISFRNELRARLSVTANYDEFDKVYLQVLNNHAPMKSKAVQANHASYMSKALRKAIMGRSYLEGKYYKTRDPEMGRLYRKQRNFSSRLDKKERKKYHTRLDIRKVTFFRCSKKPWGCGKFIHLK